MTSPLFFQTMPTYCVLGVHSETYTYAIVSLLLPTRKTVQFDSVIFTT
jgi:hypothetical protein